MAPTVTYSLVSTDVDVAELVNAIQSLPQCDTLSLYVDLEGAKLSRDGTLSLLNVFVAPKNHVCLVDVHTLQSTAFTAPSADGTTLGDILESPSITKVFFDARNDSDALFSHYGIRLRGVEDVQLMENASRLFNRGFLSGLASCLKHEGQLSVAELAEWTGVKNAGARLFGPEHGGSYAVFDARPLSPEIQKYCVNDVRYLPRLRMVYMSRLSGDWPARVERETLRRITDSQSPDYNPNGRDKAISPWAGI